jgi:signal peptidase
VKILTKGDNNAGDDRAGMIYAPNQKWVTKSEIIGRARGYLPFVGMVTILMNDYPILKYVLLGGLAVFVLLHRE